MEACPTVRQLKILIVGESGVGKTSLLLRFTDGEFDPTREATVGVDFRVKVVGSNGNQVRLALWDTAGQERFRCLTLIPSYYRGAHGAILVYDVSSQESFQKVQGWLDELETFSTNRGLVKMLIGNKCDLDAERTVTREEGLRCARKYRMMFMEASAKTNEGVTVAFEELGEKIVRTPGLLEATRAGRELPGVGGEQADQSVCNGFC